MRKAWLICLVFIANLGVAQTTFVGVKAGGHVSSAFIEHTIFNLNVNTTFLPGLNGGVYVKYLPKPGKSFLNSGFQFGVNYVQKGWKQSFRSDLPNYTARLNYLEVPLEGFGYFGGKNKYYISAGLYMEFLLSSDLDEEPDFAIEPNLDTPGSEDFYTYDEDRDREIGYGVRLSGGAFRDLSIGTFQLEGFFSYSFSNFMDPGDLTTPVPDLSNNWTFGFTVGYMFAVSKNKGE